MCVWGDLFISGTSIGQAVMNNVTEDISKPQFSVHCDYTLPLYSSLAILANPFPNPSPWELMSHHGETENNALMCMGILGLLRQN